MGKNTIMPANTVMITDQSESLRLQTWLSPAFPVGGYSFSHGLETAIEKGLLDDRYSLIDWLEADISHGTGHVEVIFLAAAWRAVTEQNADALVEAADFAAALRATSEFSLESGTQGTAFLSTVMKVWPSEVLVKAVNLLRASDITPVLPIAVGIACAAERISLEQTAPQYLQAWSANLINAAVRAIPLGQTDGQHIVAALETRIAECASKAVNCSLDDVGSATLMIDVMSMHHETQYTRIFRS